MDSFHWALAALLGISLAASTGLNTFLPLLMLAAAAHFHVAGIILSPKYAWLASNTALVGLGVAAAIEIVGDKFPAVDHGLDAIGTVVRPAAGALATASVFNHMDPAAAAVAGLVIGAPTSFGFHTAKAAARVTSSVATLGCASPLISLIEDFVAINLVLIGLFAPLLVPVVLCLVIWGLCKLVKAARRRLAVQKAAVAAHA